MDQDDPFASIWESIDHRKLGRIVRRHGRTGFGRHKPHYIDLMACLAKDFHEAGRLGLRHGTPKRILDIGTGPGAFAHVLAHFGHEVVATEREDDESTMWYWWHSSKLRRWWTRIRLDKEGLRNWLRSRHTLYGDMAELLGVERLFWTVREGEPAPELGGPFDLIGARALYFDHPGSGRPTWGTDAWRFFVDDMERRFLAPGGELLLTFTHDRRDLDTLFAEFERSGARVSDHQVTADRVACRRFVEGG